MAGNKNFFSSSESGESFQEKNDEQKMEKLLEEAKGVLFVKSIEEKIQKEAEETIKKEETFEKGKAILSKEAQEEIDFIEQQFEDLLDNSQRRGEMFRFLKKEYGWDENETWAMLGVLRHGLTSFYYGIEFKAPDEAVPEVGTRSVEDTLFQLIAHDYTQETALKVSPLIRLYLQGAKKLLKERKKAVK